MGISIWQLLIILAIVLVLFGAKRLRNLGGDLGTAVRGFRDAMKEGEAESDTDGDKADSTVGGHLGSDTSEDEDFVEGDPSQRSTESQKRD